MRFSIEVFNLQKQLDSAQPGQQPRPVVHIMRSDKPSGTEALGMRAARPGDPEWRSLAVPLTADPAPNDWSISKGGTFASVPLFPYLVDREAPEFLVQFAMGQAIKALHLAPRDATPSRMLIAIGNVCRRADRQPGYEVWLGFSFEID